MILDIVCLFGILLFLVGGVISGFLRQVVRLVALLGAFLLVSPFSGVIRGFLAGKANVDDFPGNLLVLVLAWLAGYLILLVTGMLLLRVVRGVTSSISGSDRAMGGLIGMLKGGLIVYALVTVLLFFQDPFRKFVPEASGEMKESRVVNIVKENNPLMDWMEELQERIREIDLQIPAAL